MSGFGSSISNTDGFVREPMAPDVNPLDVSAETQRRAESAARFAESMRPGPGFLQLAGDAIESNFIIYGLLRQSERAAYDPNRWWSPNEEEFDALVDGLDERYWGEFNSITSKTDAYVLRSQLLEAQGRRERLAQAGLGGLALEVAAQVADPVSLAAGAVSGGIGWASTGTRLTRLMRAGLISASVEGSLEAAIAFGNPDRGADDVLFAAAGAFALGGAIASIGRTGDAAKLVQELRQELDAQAVRNVAGRALSAAPDDAAGGAQFSRLDDASEQLELRVGAVLDAVASDRGRRYFTETNPEKRAAQLKKIIRLSGLDPEDATDAQIIARLESIGTEDFLRQVEMEARDLEEAWRMADDTPDLLEEPTVLDDGDVDVTQQGPDLPLEPPRPPKQAGDFVPDINAARPGFARARYSFASLLGLSKVPLVRQLFSVMADDALLKADGSGSRVSGTVWKDRTVRTTLAPFVRQNDFAYNEYARAVGLGARKYTATERTKFNKMVTQAVRDRKYKARFDTHPEYVRKAADAWAEFTERMHGIGLRHGAISTEVKYDPSYVPRIWSTRMLQSAIDTYGDDAVTRLLSNAVLAGTVNAGQRIDKAIADRIAVGMKKTILSREYTDIERTRIFGGKDPTAVNAWLRSTEVGLSEEDAARVIAIIKERPTDFSGGRNTQRTLLDETAGTQVAGGVELRVADLVEQDIEQLAAIYAEGISASSAYQTLLDAFEVKSWDALEVKIRDQGQKLRLTPDQVNRDLNRLDVVRRHLLGLPLNTQTDPSVRTWLQRLRSLNFIRLSGGFGVAQIPEMANIIAEAGVSVMMKAMPELPRLFKTAANGRLSSGMLDFLESYVGVGSDRIMHRFFGSQRIDYELAQETFGKVDRALLRGSRIAADASGLSAINIMLQRMAGVAAVQRMWKYAEAGTTPSKKRLVALFGGTEDEAVARFERVRSAMKAEAEASRGVAVVTGPTLGRRVADVDPSKWSDQEAASLLIDSINRWSNRVIQANDIGNIAPWATTELGKVMLQFKSFVLVAYEKQTLHRIQMRDTPAVMGALLSAALAGIAYAAQTNLRSIGRPDEDEFRAQMLSERAIILAGIQRSGAVSVLPDVVEFFGQTVGADPIFAYRNTGLANGILDANANPTVSMLNNAYRAAGSSFQAAIGTDPMTQADMRAATGLLPFRKLLGVSNLLDRLDQSFPERVTRDD